MHIHKFIDMHNTYIHNCRIISLRTPHSTAKGKLGFPNLHGKSKHRSSEFLMIVDDCSKIHLPWCNSQPETKTSCDMKPRVNRV